MTAHEKTIEKIASKFPGWGGMTAAQKREVRKMIRAKVGKAPPKAKPRAGHTKPPPPPGLVVDLEGFTVTDITLSKYSPAFELVLVHGERRLCAVSNGGDGGSHRWRPCPKGVHKASCYELRSVINALLNKTLPHKARGREVADLFISAFADGAKDGAEAVALITDAFG
jgi:hypothetical protein